MKFHIKEQMHKIVISINQWDVIIYETGKIKGSSKKGQIHS